MADAKLRQRIRSTIEASCQPAREMHQADEESRIVYLMRGLPSCGKSTTARRIAGDRGLVIETDAYFQGDRPGPESYRFDRSKLKEARLWTLSLFDDALQKCVSPIVIDRGNGRNAESKLYVEMAIDQGYSVRLREPDSAWWNEIRVLLKYRPSTDEVLDVWAEELARLSEKTHRVKLETIRKWMSSWVSDLTIDDVLRAE